MRRTGCYLPGLVNNELPLERTIGEMTLAGVDVGVLQSDHVYGDLAEYFGEAMWDYPGTLHRPGTDMGTRGQRRRPPGEA